MSKNWQIQNEANLESMKELSHEQIMDDFFRNRDEIRAKLVWSLVDKDRYRHIGACQILGIDPKLDIVDTEKAKHERRARS